MLQFTINAYTNHLKSLGYKNVPTNAYLATVIGITPTSFSRLAMNKANGPNRLQIEAIIAEFRRRGFSTTQNDLLRYVPDTSSNQIDSESETTP